MVTVRADKRIKPVQPVLDSSLSFAAMEPENYEVAIVLGNKVITL